ncbi:MAG: hypothetical protein U5J63_00490 [Fodinibius sp.]|nr:hypothetical protein [Fodinibius sp.]
MTNAGTGGGGGNGDGEGPVATIHTHEVRINAIFFEGNRRALTRNWRRLVNYFRKRS